MDRRDFLRTAIMSSGLICTGEFFNIEKLNKISELNIDSVLRVATSNFLVKADKSKGLLIHHLDTKKHGTIYVYLSQNNLKEFVEFTRKNAGKISNGGIYAPLSKLTKKDMEICLLSVIKNKKVETKPLDVFTHKWIYNDKIISIEPESIFFVSNELSGKDKYDYANVIIFEQGIHVHSV